MSLKYLYALNFVDLLGFSILIPLLNPRIISIGGNLLWVGIIASLTSGAQLIGSPIVGSWSDSRGRKPVLIATLILVLLSNFLLSIPSLLILTLSRLIFGIAHHTDTIFRTIIADTVPASDVSSYSNKMGAFGGLAFMFGPLCGGILYDKLQSFTLISILLSVLNVVLIIIVYLWIEDKPQTEDIKKEEKKEDEDKKETDNVASKGLSGEISKIFENLKEINWDVYGDMLLYKFLTEAAFNMLFMNMGVILTTTYAFQQIHIGYTISFISIVMVAASLMINRVNSIFYKNDPTGHQRIVQGFSAMGVFLTILCFANTWPLYLSVILLSMIAKVLLDSVITEVLSLRTTDSDRGIIMGACTSALSLAGLVCPLISGAIGNYMGVSALSLLPIIPTATSLVFIFTSFKESTIKQD